MACQSVDGADRNGKTPKSRGWQTAVSLFSFYSIYRRNLLILLKLKKSTVCQPDTIIYIPPVLVAEKKTPFHYR